MVAPRVEFPDDDLNRAAAAAAEGLQKFRHNMLEQIGTQILSYVKLDYVAKSRGGTGTDGIHWAPLKVGTILARLRKAGHLKTRRVAGTNRTEGVIAKSVKANEALFKQLARAGVKFRDKKGNAIKGTKPRSKAGNTVGTTKEIREKSVKLAPGSYQIGVDTGLQLNSAGPGYKGPDGKGGNVMTYTEDTVTVGFGRSYSEHFDKHRKLIPDVLPEPWRKELEGMVAAMGGRIIEDTLESEGVS